MRRGDIWEADIGGRAGKRPVLVLTRSNVIPHLSKVVIAEITTQGKGYPTQIDVGTAGNLRKHSFVAAECLHTLPKECLTRYIGELPPPLLRRVADAITFALALDDVE